MVELPPGFLSLALPTPPPPPPLLLDELVEEIFLRVPPDDPARLLRAALVCRHWARLLADRGFRRRYRERHAAGRGRGRGRPPLLGFLANLDADGGSARFVPNPTLAFSFSPARASLGDYRAHDARHGRVLLNRIAWDEDGARSQDDDDEGAALAVSDPIADELRPLPAVLRPREVCSWNAAVLCAPHLTNCDHLDCCCGHFLVAFVGTDDADMFAHVYSSESAASDEGISAELPHDPFDENLPGALARNALYFEFKLVAGDAMLKYDLATRSLSLLSLPHRPYVRCLVAMEVGGLGFAEVDSQFNLNLWAMATDGSEGDAGNWAVHRAIDLSTGLPAPALRTKPCVAAFADGAGVFFLRTADGLYTFDLKTGQSTYVMTNYFYGLIPYVSFYTPVLRVATTGEGPRAGASIALQT